MIGSFTEILVELTVVVVPVTVKLPRTIKLPPESPADGYGSSTILVALVSVL